MALLSVGVSTRLGSRDLQELVRGAVRRARAAAEEGAEGEPSVWEERDLCSPPNYEDVVAFHQRFRVPMSPVPAWLDLAATRYRVDFMTEELEEFGSAYREGDLRKAADALADLVYVALGTAAMMGLPWQRVWDEVQRANMAKARSTGSGDAQSARRSALDVVKPAGWAPPDHSRALGDGPWPTYMTGEGRLSEPTPAERWPGGGRAA